MRLRKKPGSRQRLPWRRSGFGLIVLVTLLAIVSILIGVSASVFVQTMRETQLRIDRVKASYLARAGVMKAIWDWYKSDTATELNRRWAPISQVVTGNLGFKVGMDASAAPLQSNYAFFTSTSDVSAYAKLEKNIGTNTNKTSNASIAVTVPAAGVAQGNYVVVSLALDANGTNPGCTDTQGNTYTRHEDAAATNTANDVRLALFSAPVATALVSGNTITCSWTNNTTSEAITAAEYSNITAFDQSISASATSGTAPSSGLITTTYASELLVGAIATEGPSGDTFTAGTDYINNPPTRVGTTGGSATTNVTIAPEYQRGDSTADYVADATITNRGWSAALAAFRSPDRWVSSGANRRLTQWQVYNMHSTSSITLEKIRVNWTGGGAAQLNDFVLNGVSKWPGGTAASGDIVDIADTALASGAFWGGTSTYLQWDNGGPADPVTVTCQFIFSGDASTSDPNSRNVILWDGAQAGGGLPQRRAFDIISTGSVDQSSSIGFKVLQTVKAVASASPGLASIEIVDWDESEHNIP